MNGNEDTLSTLSRQFDREKFQQLLTTNVIALGDRFIYQSVVTSTNTLAMSLAQQGALEGTVVLADSQTAGKGRQGRHWVDMAGCHVLSSTILYPLFLPYLLIMIASTAVVDTIAELCGLSATIKWPNDIQIDNHKVSGILIETSRDRSGRLIAIVGIGSNVNGSSAILTEQTSQLTYGVPRQVMTLEDACGHPVDRETFLAYLLKHLENGYLALQEEARMAPQTSGPIARLVRAQWRQHLSTLGRTITVHQGSQHLSGVAEDVSENGELLLRCLSGERRCITWGDVIEHSQLLER